MNGPEHYRKAEELARGAEVAAGQWEDGYEHKARISELLSACAQVHATLAVAAATALGAQTASDDGMSALDEYAWLEVASAAPEGVEYARKFVASHLGGQS